MNYTALHLYSEVQVIKSNFKIECTMKRGNRL